jgi:hypothetical protein
MSLHKHDWTVNQLAVEFGIDRRTVAKRLDAARVRPIRTVRGSRHYRLADTLPVILPPQRAEGEDSRSMDQLLSQLGLDYIRAVFSEAEPFALVLQSHTTLSPEAILRLLKDLYAVFDRVTAEVLTLAARDPVNLVDVLKGFSTELHDDARRGALLERLTKARRVERQ